MTTPTLTALTISRVSAGVYNVDDSRGDKYTITKDGGNWAVSFRGSTDPVSGIPPQPTLKAAKRAIARRDARIIADRPAGTPLPPVPVTLTRAERFDDKRAERLTAKGATADTIVSADVALAGKGSEGENSCALCDHGILWLFILHLSLKDGSTVTINPVGSKCIETWANALPVGEAQAAILASLQLALEEAKAFKVRLRTLRNLRRDGRVSQEQHDLLLAFYAAPVAVRKGNEFLSDVAQKAISRGFTERQWSTWSRAAKRAISAGSAAPKAAPAEPAPVTDAAQKSLEDILARANAVITSGHAARLSYGGDALVDISEKLQRYGSFASDKQEAFLRKLVKAAEGLAAEDAPPARKDDWAQPVAEGGFFGQDMFASAAQAAPEQSATPHAEDDYDDLPF